MPTYRVGSIRGRTVSGLTPCALVCEVCEQELDETVHVEQGQERYAGMTVPGVTRVWPALADPVQRHETRCRGPKH
jgi:hypothetical protein